MVTMPVMDSLTMAPQALVCEPMMEDSMTMAPQRSTPMNCFHMSAPTDPTLEVSMSLDPQGSMSLESSHVSALTDFLFEESVPSCVLDRDIKWEEDIAWEKGIRPAKY